MNEKFWPVNHIKGQYVNITVVIKSTSTTLNGLNVQFPIANDFRTLGYPSTTLSVPAGGSATARLTYQIPAGQPNGYLRVGVGVFSSSWSNYKWEDVVAIIGVNKVVGSYSY